MEEHNHDHSHNHIHHTQDSKMGYLILGTILSSILVMSITYGFFSNNLESMNVMRVFMGLFFVLFGLFKAMSLKEFANIYAGYDLVAKRSKAYGYIYPFIEIALGLSYLFSYQLVSINIITASLMLLGSLGVLNELKKKNRIPCACLGAIVSLPLTTVSLIENLSMGAMALMSLAYLL